MRHDTTDSTDEEQIFQNEEELEEEMLKRIFPVFCMDMEPEEIAEYLHVPMELVGKVLNE